MERGRVDDKLETQLGRMSTKDRDVKTGDDVRE